MEFYKEGKVLTVNVGDTLDLSSAVYNHKAAIIKMNGTSLGGASTVQIKFWNKTNKTEPMSLSPIADIAGIIDARTDVFTNMFIPARLAEIIYSTGTAGTKIDVILFN